MEHTHRGGIGGVDLSTRSRGSAAELEVQKWYEGRGWRVHRAYASVVQTKGRAFSRSHDVFGLFDLVYSRDNFEHSIAPYIALLEFKRVLSADGRMVIIVPGPEWIWEKEHPYVLNEAQMRQLVEICGLEVVGFQYQEYPEAAVNQFRYIIKKGCEDAER